MNCGKVRINLSAYTDDVIDAQRRLEVADHLKHCTACRKEFEELSSIDTLVRSLPQYSLPAEFARAISARANDSIVPGQGRHSFHRAWKAVLEYSERFLDLLEPEAPMGTRSLDEFNDIPASFIGYAYFNIVGSQRRGF